MVKKKDLQNTGKQELEKQLKEMRIELMKSNSQIASGTTPKNPGQMKQMKKTIARILTILSKKDKEEVKTAPKTVKKAEDKKEKPAEKK